VISRKKIALHIKNATIPETMQVYVTGPIRNNKTGKTHWVIVFGDSGQAWVLKGPFLTGYIKELLSQVKLKNINVDHCQSYYEINIRNGEYGEINFWKRKMSYQGRPNQTVKRISFVYSCDTATENATGKACLCEAINYFFLTMKKRHTNPIGPLIVDFLKEQASGKFKYFLKKYNNNEDLIADNITEDINKQYRGDYNINWNYYLNHWMVDYNIIHILKWHIRYSTWTDVPMKTRNLCYKSYHDKFNLPDWDTNQEAY